MEKSRMRIRGGSLEQNSLEWSKRGGSLERNSLEWNKRGFILKGGG